MKHATQTKRENILFLILAILLWYLTYEMILAELQGVYADYNGHTYVYLPMFSKETFWEGWKAVPYCMWHLSVLFLNHFFKIPLEISVAYVSCILTLTSYFIVYWIIQKYTTALACKETSAKSACLSFGFCILQSIYLSWTDAGARFLGLFSMNPLHNPTQMAVRPFSLLCFCLVYDILKKQKEDTYKGVFFNMDSGLKKSYLYLSITLFLSTLAKPTFAEMLIPAVGLIMLAEWLHRISLKNGSGLAYFKHCLHMLYCALPALGYILLQMLAYFFWGGSYGGDGGGVIITKFLEVWHLFSENVALSILLAMTLPIFLLLFDSRFFLKDEMGLLALVGYLVGFLEAALLGESGGKLDHADFIWPMMSGMLFMWLASLLRLLNLERTQADTKVKCFLIDTAWLLFWIHVFFGLLYIRSSIVAIN